MPALEKDYFTLAEIMHRWRYAGVDESVLLKLAADDKLVFSIYIRDIGSHAVTHETEEGVITRTTDVVFNFRDPTRISSIQFLRSDDARRILEAKPHEKIKVRGHYSTPTRTKETGLGYFNNAPLLTREDLLVSKSERDRFENEAKILLQPPVHIRAWTWLSDQSNQSALKMLSGWFAAAATGAWAIWQWLH